MLIRCLLLGWMRGWGIFGGALGRVMNWWCRIVLRSRLGDGFVGDGAQMSGMVRWERYMV